MPITGPVNPGGVLLESDAKFATYADCAAKSATGFVPSGTYKNTDYITVSKLIAADFKFFLDRDKIKDYASTVGKTTVDSINNYFIPKFYVQFDDDSGGGSTDITVTVKNIPANTALILTNATSLTTTVASKCSAFNTALSTASTGSGKVYNKVSGTTVTQTAVDTSTALYLFKSTTRVMGPLYGGNTYNYGSNLAL